MSIRDVVERARSEPPYLPPATEFPDNFYRCEVLDPIPWDRQAFEQSLGMVLPDVLVELWDACGGMKLYCDSLWLPSGLVLCSPTDADFLKENARFQRNWKGSILPGDLVFASFRDSLEQALVRCDRSADDYGSAIIVAEMDRRPDWEFAASSIEEFLLKYMDARGQKFWEYHYKRRQAERAAQQNPEGK